MIDEAEDIESLAALPGLQMIFHMEVDASIFESDSLKVVEALKSHTPNLSRQGNMIDEITDLLKLFASYEVTHVVREGNEAAHKLTRHAKFVEDIRV